ncbi:MAG: hypothetical protein ACOC5T_01975 [Elusimicrobiota bacterium]
MVLEISEDSLFPKRQQIEGTTPAKYEIGWTEQLTQNISRSLAIDTFTLAENTTKENSFLQIFDQDTTTYIKLTNDAGDEETTTIILDLGIVTRVHSTILEFTLSNNTVVTKNTVTTYYSSDKTNWTQIDTDNYNGSSSSAITHYLTATTYRYLKITHTTEADTHQSNLYIKEIQAIR